MKIQLKICLYLSMIMFVEGCFDQGVGPGPKPNTPPVTPHVPPSPPAPKPKETERVQISAPLSPNARMVLKAAFETDYPVEQDFVNAYDFAQYKGNKGMDWWNFPWDLPSSMMQYTISFQDMADLLSSVKVRKSKDSDTFVRYAEMLKEMVGQLTPEIMNAHGGYLRVVKIIYCVRNFLAVAERQGLVIDIPSLQQAAKKLISIYETNQLVSGQSPYVKGSSYQPRNLDGQPEDRTAELGIQELRQLAK